jgi:hypothetical protein
VRLPNQCSFDPLISSGCFQQCKSCGGWLPNDGQRENPNFVFCGDVDCRGLKLKSFAGFILIGESVQKIAKENRGTFLRYDRLRQRVPISRAPLGNIKATRKTAVWRQVSLRGRKMALFDQLFPYQSLQSFRSIFPQRSQQRGRRPRQQPGPTRTKMPL